MIEYYYNIDQSIPLKTREQIEFKYLTSVNFLPYLTVIEIFTKKGKKRLDGFHHKCLRKILGVKYQDGLRNVAIRERLNRKR